MAYIDSSAPISALAAAPPKPDEEALEGDVQGREPKERKPYPNIKARLAVMGKRCR